jgi:hypothetical protein
MCGAEVMHCTLSSFLWLPGFLSVVVGGWVGGSGCWVLQVELVVLAS